MARCGCLIQEEMHRSYRISDDYFLQIVRMSVRVRIEDRESDC